MAAISNQDWKKAAMQRAEKITDLWDIVKAYCGRSAEVVLSVCMFASIIGVLPGVHYPGWAGNVILSVQIIMLDMGGFALHTMAEHARENGQEAAAHKAETMATFLIRLVIVTLGLITIGQLSSIAGSYAGLVRTIADYAETGLILVRVVSTVQFIHVIHSLRGSAALSIEPTQPAASLVHVERMDQLEETIKRLNERLTTIMAERQHRGQPTQPTSSPIHPPLLSTSILEEPTHVAVQIAQKSGAALDASVVQYPVVSGVSDRKVKELIDAFVSGTKWRDLPGNYSQTIKPVKEAYELFHQPTQISTQPIQNV